MNGTLSEFERGTLPQNRDLMIARGVRAGLSVESATAACEKLLRDEVWISTEYQVNIDRDPPHGFTGMKMMHFSIKRRDKRPIHDWRDLQAIKDRFAGPDHEAIELYPARDRLVDTSNQYHLWVFVDGGDGKPPRIPVGWTDGANVATSGDGAKQRRIA